MYPSPVKHTNRESYISRRHHFTLIVIMFWWQYHTWGRIARVMALILRRPTLTVWISDSNWLTASCSRSSCSTAFLLGGALTRTAFGSFPLLNCLRHSITIAARTNTNGSMKPIHPLHNIRRSLMSLNLHNRSKHSIITFTSYHVTELYHPLSSCLIKMKSYLIIK